MDKDCGCGAAVFAGMSVSYKRVLWIVITINAAMFLVEMVAGVHGQSVALQADALDFAFAPAMRMSARFGFVAGMMPSGTLP